MCGDKEKLTINIAISSPLLLPGKGIRAFASFQRRYSFCSNIINPNCIMTLFDKFLKGDTIQVYHEIYSLGQEALSENNFPQTDLILNETFKRVKYNLEVIYKELKNINYQFISDINYDWQRPITQPDPNIDSLLSKIQTLIVHNRHIPLSLQYFYKYVGSCNFCWDWKTMPEIPWEGADPIDIPPIKDLIEMIEEGFDEEQILLSGDFLQKDNISGSCYNLALTKQPSIDSFLLHENWDMYFIEYLRITFENCGFSMADQCEYDSLNSFCKKVKKQLLTI